LLRVYRHGHSSGIKQEAVHRLIASEASLALLISSKALFFNLVLFCFLVFVFPFFLPELLKCVHHAKKSSRTSNPALYKEPNRQETREAQDRSTESID